MLAVWVIIAFIIGAVFGFVVAVVLTAGGDDR